MVSLVGAIIMIVIGAVLLYARTQISEKIIQVAFLIAGAILFIVGIIFLIFYFIGPELFILPIMLG